MVGNNCYNICMWALVCVLCRDQMGVVDVKVSSGQLDVSKEKNLLVWTLGRYCAPEHQCKRKKHIYCSYILEKETMQLVDSPH